MISAPGWKLHSLMKRTIDVAGAIVGLIVSAPVLALIAIAIRFTSKGPVLFLQERTGQGGVPFHVVKFRTMAPPREPVADEEAKADDPRITLVGGFLRKSGLDELPQLVNVLRGEMSLVGPRPLLAWENDLCNPRQSRRLHMKPGITGLSQVNGRNAIPWADRVEWDVIYVDRPGVMIDLKIMLLTVPTVLFGRHAYAPTPIDDRISGAVPDCA